MSPGLGSYLSHVQVGPKIGFPVSSQFNVLDSSSMYPPVGMYRIRRNRRSNPVAPTRRHSLFGCVD